MAVTLWETQIVWDLSKFYLFQSKHVFFFITPHWEYPVISRSFDTIVRKVNFISIGNSIYLIFFSDVNNATVRFGDKGTCINAEEGGYNRLKFNFGGRPDMILQKLAHKFAMPILQGNMDTETPHAILIRVNDKKIFKATASFPHTDDYMALSTPSCPDIPTVIPTLAFNCN